MFRNPHRQLTTDLDRARLGLATTRQVTRALEACPAYGPTPLVSLPAFAAATGVASVHVKGEWARMGLGSFKALGGAYAVAGLVAAQRPGGLGPDLAAEALVSPAARRAAQGLTVVCASAGNHGLSVAAGAQVFGARAVVFLSDAVPDPFRVRLQGRGARVIRAGATYEDSLRAAAKAAEAEGWVLVSDRSSPDDSALPLQIMRGYGVAAEEAAEALEASGGPASHVIVQAGVGGLAAAVAAYLRDRWGEGFQFTVVEPAGAPCLLESVRAGRPVRTAAGGSRLGRLDCAEPSLLAFDMLIRGADAFMTIEDAEAEAAADRLAGEGAPVSPCGAAGAAGLMAMAQSPDARRAVGLTPASRVLLIGTEAAEQSSPSVLPLLIPEPERRP